MTHTCHARDCDVAVPAKMFMCRKHWFSLPPDIRAAVWRAYVPGQENRKDPTNAYLEIANRAINYIAEKEAKK